jgi:alanyl-tRNA synthetase
MLKILANVLTRDNDVTVLIATLGDGDQPKVTVIFARPPNHPWNMNELLKNTIGIINGKGGGKPEFAQGMGEPKNIHQLMDTAHNLLLNKGV